MLLRSPTPGWRKVPRPSGSAASEESKLAYIKGMIEYARDDARQVYLRVTGAFAVAVLFLTQLPFDKLAALDGTHTRLLFGGLALMVLGAVFHFAFLSEIHKSQRHLLACLPAANVEAAYDALVNATARGIWRFRVGDVLTLVGVILLAIVLWELLALPLTPESSARRT